RERVLPAPDEERPREREHAAGDHQRPEDAKGSAGHYPPNARRRSSVTRRLARTASTTVRTSSRIGPRGPRSCTSGYGAYRPAAAAASCAAAAVPATQIATGGSVTYPSATSSSAYHGASNPSPKRQA